MILPRASSLLGRPLFVLCAFALAASFFMPVRGYGIPSCGFLLALHRPCFGCGMTRAITCLSQLEFELAWRYHPFSFVLWPVMATMALGAILPPFGRFLLDAVIRRHDRVLTIAFWTGAAIFFAYGFWRMFAEPDWSVRL